MPSHCCPLRLVLLLCLLTLPSLATPAVCRQTLPSLASKPQIVVQTGHTGAVMSVAFSPDGKTLASASWDNTIKLWDTATGQELRTLTGHTYWVAAVAFSPDGKTLASGGWDKTVKVWDVATGELKRTLSGHTGWVYTIAFSPDGKFLASGGDDHAVRLWDTDTGRKRHLLTEQTDAVTSVAFSPDSRSLAGVSQQTITLWDTATGRETRRLVGTAPFSSVVFSRDGSTLIGAGSDHAVTLWGAAGAGLSRTLTGHEGSASVSAFSPDRKTLVTGDADKTLRVWDAATGGLKCSLTGHTDSVLSVAFSPDGKTLTSGSNDHAVRLWDAETGRERHPFTGHTDSVNTVTFSRGGRTLVGGSGDGAPKVWDLVTGQLQRARTGEAEAAAAAATSPDGKIFAYALLETTITLRDTATKKTLRRLAGHTDRVNSLAFSPDSRTLASGSSDATIKLWDIAAGTLARTLTGHTDSVRSVAFTPDGKVLASASDDHTVKLWDTATGRELAGLYALGDDDWAVVTPEGRFDASPGGLTQMHYVVGLEPIDLVQLKDRYYEPGLLAKLLGFNKEPLRDVRAFDHVDLTPDVTAASVVPAGGRLLLTLTNRGGGIGRVQVFVNGKELVADARGQKPDPTAKTAVLTVDVSHAPGLVPGKPNAVWVVTWNAEGYLSSRGFAMAYTPPGAPEAAPPDLWAIVGGISDYAEPSLHLLYPAKDAGDFAHALSRAAKNLFGADNVHLTLLETGTLPPTKASLQKAFEAARKAKPGDIFVVYLAGHGVALPGPSDSSGSHDLYCYLTQDATTGSPAALSADTQLRLATTVSSEELTNWIKQIPAQKQVMVLDTCAAGAAAARLTAKRDIPSDQKRAIERLKDRTGFYVLMGCAADAASYETSQYRQGLLTYSLLKGMKGASLRDGQYVDVSGLFSYAVDEVPKLAQNIGGVQRPFVAAPEAASFDMGELSAADRQAIPLAAAVPFLLRPELVALDDDLNLEELLTVRLREESARPRGDAEAPAPSFLDAASFPGAIQPRGTYTVAGQTVSVTVKLRQDGVALKMVQVSGTRADLPGLITKLAAAILSAAGTP